MTVEVAGFRCPGDSVRSVDPAPLSPEGGQPERIRCEQDEHERQSPLALLLDERGDGGERERGSRPHHRGRSRCPTLKPSWSGARLFLGNSHEAGASPLTAAQGVESTPPGLSGSGGVHPVRRIVTIVFGIVAAGALAVLLGWDIRGWFADLWDTITTISTADIVAAVVVMTLQTTATAYAWYTILRFAYPREVRWMQVLAAYSVCVALNNVLPANLGTIVMFVMLTTLIASATFVGVVSGFLVEKLFFTVAAVFVYLYLFLSVEGSFDIRFAWIRSTRG